MGIPVKIVNKIFLNEDNTLRSSINPMTPEIMIVVRNTIDSFLNSGNNKITNKMGGITPIKNAIPPDSATFVSEFL